MKKLRPLSVLFVTVGLCVALPRAAEAESVKADAATATVTAPAGEFAQLRLDFDAPAPWSLLATVRDGRVRVDDLIGVREPGGWLDLNNGKLTGSFRRQLWGTKLRLYQFTVNATVNGDAVTGVCTVRDLTVSVTPYVQGPGVQAPGLDGDVEKPAAKTVEKAVQKPAPETPGKVIGQLTRETALAKDNAIEAGASWDSFLGPAGAGGAGTAGKARLVDNLTQARLVWRSEEPLPQVYAPLTRFMYQWNDAGRLRAGAGSSSPVLADGKVFVFYRHPRVSPFQKAHGQEFVPAMEAAAKLAGFDILPEFAREKGYSEADEVVVAMDAATGKTLWRAVTGHAVANIQNHKERTSDRSPAYADGRLYVPGRAGFVYAFDGATGRLLWEKPADGRQPMGGIHGAGMGAWGVVAGGGTVVVPAGGTWAGLDGATGAVRWTLTGARADWCASRWNSRDGARFLAVVNRSQTKEPKHELVCVDAAGTKPLWTQPIAPLASAAGLSVAGDIALAYCFLDPTAGDAWGHDQIALKAWRLGPQGATEIWTAPGFRVIYGIPVAVNGNQVFATINAKFMNGNDARAAVLDLETGRKLSELTVTDAEAPGNGGYVQVMGSLAIVRLDGTHGGNQFVSYAVAPDGALGKPVAWEPPQFGGRTHTTSYHHPIMYAYGDGRVFLRQYDGIYCYDLRLGK